MAVVFDNIEVYLGRGFSNIFDKNELLSAIVGQEIVIEPPAEHRVWAFSEEDWARGKPRADLNMNDVVMTQAGARFFFVFFERVSMRYNLLFLGFQLV